MNQLVFTKNGQVLTDSLHVAEVFGKEHKHVLRDIENLDCSEEFRKSNFGPSSYKSKQNKELPKVDMTRDGFTFLAMGYTGKEAARFKEMYIGEFNRMEAQLNVNTHALSPELQMFKCIFDATAKIQLAQAKQDNRLTVVEQRQEHITDVLSLHMKDPMEWRKKVNKVLNSIAQKGEEQQSYLDVRRESYRLLEERAKCDLVRRLRNRQNTMVSRGLPKSHIAKVNRLDIIASDTRLTEIYLSIVKELAILYNVDIAG